MDIKDLLGVALEYKASDIHFTVGIPPVFRIDGKLIRLKDIGRIMPDDTKQIADQLFDDYTRKVFEENGEVDFSHSIIGIGRFRVNIFKQRGSISLALRAVPLEVPTTEDLKLPDIINKLADNRRGLVLVTGPTGSGKSTTLAAMLNHINQTRGEHILTLEDPIEYLHRHGKSIVNQREIHHDSKSYANALRAALRQDPDVILIGEMRDLETISIAVTAAETGHLVFSSLHTIGAVSTIDRIIDVFPPNQQQQIKVQLASVLQGVVSQQLIKRLDEKGRVAAIEVMIANAAVRNHIREGKAHMIMNSIQTGRKDGMISMDTYLSELYKKKQISYDEALSHSIDKDMLMRLI
ncbi:type IV pilus twitching motility protein PilT [Helicovermis profundi]|uniref:Type IV pilus twitching motility protein PilT n=1 Tax=Helicovermis profundi TaxID=3065157 RepID=A0AAU9EAQ8_9FIRM|nr:type IV pilus twitching motility protein PilT [Clostridia bacterium S502]